jgi:phosphate uptake regulator
MNMGGSDPVEGHTAKAFDAALSDLRLQIVGMGGLVIDQVSAAVRALLDGDAAVADLVLSREKKVNELERFVDREAFRLIALHQPMASDLRMAKAASRITVELERAGEEDREIRRSRRHGRAARPGTRRRAFPSAHGGAHDGHASRCRSLPGRIECRDGERGACSRFGARR